MTDYILTITGILIMLLLVTLIFTVTDYLINGIPFISKCSSTCKEQGYTIEKTNYLAGLCSCDLNSKVVIIE